jgi:cell division septation protein DedD
VVVVLVLVALSVAVSSTVLRDGDGHRADHDAATLEEVVAAVEAQDVDCDVARPVHPPDAVVEELRLIPGSFVVAGSTSAEDEAAMVASIEPVTAVAQDLPDTAGYDLLRCNDAWIVVDTTTAHAVLLGPSTDAALEELEGFGVPVEVLQLTA